MLFKKYKFLFVVFAVMVSFSGVSSASNWNSKWTRINTEAMLRDLVVGKVMNGNCTLVIGSQNEITGNCKNGSVLTGNWRWSDDSFCRTVLLDGKIPAKLKPDQCQKVEVNIKDKKVRITSSNTGRPTLFSLTDLAIQPPSYEEANKDVSQPVVQEASSSAVTAVSSPEKSSVSVSASTTKWRNAQTPQEAQLFANEIQSSIVMFMAISEVIEKQPASLKQRVLRVVDGEITRLRAEKELLQKLLSNRFSTPIRPSNANLSVSAFRAADTFPKIPFYVPGTNEIGEMLVIPRVTDDGFLNYKFDFLDPTATYDKVRDTISIPHKNVDSVIYGLQKVDEWTKVAQENNINRRVEKSAACVPEGKCENKKQGVSSTEVMFQIYEDGSTAGRIQRNKGKFSVGYNMSVESSILLSAYLTYMRDVGAKEFNIGVMSDDEVKKLFN